MLQPVGAQQRELCMHACAGEAAASLTQQQLTALNVELGEATPVVEAYAAVQKLQAEAADLERMARLERDAEMRLLALEERRDVMQQVGCRCVRTPSCTSAMPQLQPMVCISRLHGPCAPACMPSTPPREPCFGCAALCRCRRQRRPC